MPLRQGQREMKIARTLGILLLLAAANEQAFAQGEGWLGLTATSGGVSWNFQTGKRVELPAEARVTRVEPDGPAASAGIRVDDVILALDNDPIRDGRELSEKVRLKEPGSAVLVRVKRRDDILEFKVVLGTRPLSREVHPGDRAIKRAPVP